MQPYLHKSEYAEINSAQKFVENILKESLSKLDEEELKGHTCLRWELGACWIQHLQDEKKSENVKKLSAEKTKSEVEVEGLGTSLRSIRNKKKKPNRSKDNLSLTANGINGEIDNIILPSSESQLEVNTNENEVALRRLITDDAFTRLKESGTGLHCKVVAYKFVLLSFLLLVRHIVIC